MTKIFELINTYLFAPVLQFFMDLTGGSYAWAIFLFTLAINIILIPLSVKSQKASISQLKIKPKLDELKRKYGDDKQKYNEAMQKLYQEGNVSMGGGCLPMLVRLLLVMSIFYLVTQPLTYLTDVGNSAIDTAIAALGDTSKASYKQLAVIAEAVKGNENPAFQPIISAISSIDFDFIGLDLTEKPQFSLNFSKLTSEQLKLWIIPFLSFAAAMFSSILSMIQQKHTNPDAPNMAGMMLTMPIMSLVICFSAPAGLGFYWACSSLIGAFINIFVQECFGPRKAIANEQAKLIIKKADEEKKFSSSKSV